MESAKKNIAIAGRTTYLFCRGRKKLPVLTQRNNYIVWKLHASKNRKSFHKIKWFCRKLQFPAQKKNLFLLYYQSKMEYLLGICLCCAVLIVFNIHSDSICQTILWKSSNNLRCLRSCWTQNSAFMWKIWNWARNL